MLKLDGVLDQLEVVVKLAPSGFAMALHFSGLRPGYMIQSYPAAWTSFYARNALAMVDPVIAWGHCNEGRRKWSEFSETDDPENVAAMAAAHGLRYGAACSIVVEGSRSFAGFANAEREFKESEVDQLLDALKIVHAKSLSTRSLTPSEVNALKGIGIDYVKL